MNLRPQQLFFRKRFYFIVVIFITIATIVAGRITYLTLIDRNFLQKQGDARTLRIVPIPAYRGMILDRNGEPVAVSTPVDSVWVDPREFKPSPNKLNELCQFLGITPEILKQRLHHAAKREFLYIARGLDPSTAATIKSLAIPGLFLQQEFRRFYPEGEVMAHVIGATNIDDQGQEGLELAYNDWLQGFSGKRRVIRDRLGRVVADLGIIQAPRAGHALTLSIDRRIQYLAYRELSQTIEQFKAASGSIIVLDVQSGEILAMANYPSYNPNQRPFANDGRLRNRAVTDVLEPGSVIKSFSIAAALSDGHIKPTTMIDTRPGYMNVGGNIVRDIHNVGVVNVTDVLKHSSNVGVTKIILEIPQQALWTLLNNLGFGKETNLHFPGERSGLLPYRRTWHAFPLATLAFGYGLSVTPLQLAQAYAVFAADGIKKPLSLLKVTQSVKGERIMSERVAKSMVMMMESVVQPGGSGTKAQIIGYRVAGKTGTARLVGSTGYMKDRHVASFVGIAPATHPRVVAVIVVNDLRDKTYYAGEVAAPVFSRVVADTLNLLNVAPDAENKIVQSSNSFNTTTNNLAHQQVNTYTNIKNKNSKQFLYSIRNTNKNNDRIQQAID